MNRGSSSSPLACFVLWAGILALLLAVAPAKAGGGCPEDTNGDNVVDVTDLINVVLCWLTDGQDCPDPGNDSDITDDGVVDVLDLIAVILAWGP
jgi:hypothetical protein